MLHFKKSYLSLAILFTTLVGCSGLETRETPKKLSPLSQACSKAPDASVCWKAYVQSAQMGDRGSAGQSLMVFAQTQPENVKKTWLHLAMWLNPRPWLTSKIKWSKEDLENHLSSNKIQQDGIVGFGAKSKDGNSPISWAKLPTPQKVSKDFVASTLVSAMGGQGYVRSGSTLTFAAAPSLFALTKMAFPVDEKFKLKQLNALSSAQRYFAKGQYILAQSTLATLIKVTEDSKNCDAKAPILYADGILENGLYSSGISQHKEALEELCMTQESRTPSIEFLTIVIDLEMSEIDASSESRFATEEAKSAYQTKIQNISKTLQPEQQQYIQFLWDRLILNNTHGVAQCMIKPMSSKSSSAMMTRADELHRPIMALSTAHKSHKYLQKQGETFLINVDAVLARKTALINANLGWSVAAFYNDILSRFWPNSPIIEKVKIAPICKAYQEYLITQNLQERNEGYEIRAVSRLLNLQQLSAQCPTQTRFKQLMRQTINRLEKHPSGRAAFLKFFGQLSITALFSLFDGNQSEVFGVLNIMSSEIKRVYKTLGKSDEDQTLAGILEISQSIQTGQMNIVLKTIERYATTLDKILSKPITKKDPELVRLTPILRQLTKHALLAYATGFAPQQLPKRIKDVEAVLDKDIKHILHELEQPAYLAEIIEAHLKATYAAIHLLRQPSDATAKTLKTRLTLAKTTKATKWWGMTLRFARSAGWGILAFHEHQNKRPVASKAAMQSSQQILATLIDKALVEFELQGSKWEIMRVLVPVHLVVLDYLIVSQGKDAPDDVKLEARLIKALPKIEILAKGILQRLKESTKVGEKNESLQPNFVNLTMDLIDASLSIGLNKLYDSKTETMPTASKLALSNAFEKKLKPYSTKLKVYAYTFQALLLADNKVAASKVLDKANAITRTLPGTYMYLPLLTSLRLNREGWANPKEALATLRRTMAVEQKTKSSCPEEHLKALLPQEARLLDLTGEHKAASAVRDKYFKAVDEGFAGEAVLTCQINASRGLVKANLLLGFPITSLTFEKIDGEDPQNLSTFQIGLGVVSVSENSEQIQCTVATTPKIQYARIYQVALEQAVISLYLRDFKQAQKAMGRLLRMNRYFIHVQGGLLPDSMQSLFEERTKVDLAMLRWVMTLAQMRGQWQTTKLLYDDFLKLKEFSASKEDIKRTPAFIKNIKGLYHFKDLVEATYPPENQAMDWKKIESTIKATQNKQMRKDEGLLLITTRAGLAGDLAQAKAAFSTLSKAPQSPYKGIINTLGFTLDSSQYNIDKMIIPTLKALQAQDHMLEMGLLVGVVSKRLTGTKTNLNYLINMYKALHKHSEYYIPRYAIGLTLLNEKSKIGHAETSNIFELWLKDAMGIIPWNNYVSFAYQQVYSSIKRKHYSKALSQITKLTTMMNKSYPMNHPVMIELLTLEVSLRLHENSISKRTMASYLEMTKKVQKPNAITLDLIKSYQSKQTMDDWKKIANDYFGTLKD